MGSPTETLAERPATVYDSRPCGLCGSQGVRLWRPYGSFYRPSDDRCTACAEKQEGKVRDGDSIGWMVPLVLDDCGNVWGYTSCPDDDVARWRALPVDGVPHGE